MMALWHKYASIAYGAAALLGVALLLTDGYLAKLAGSAQNLIGLFLALVTATIGAACVVIARPIIGLYNTTITQFLGLLSAVDNSILFLG